MTMEKIEKIFKESIPHVDFCSLRYEEETSQNLTVWQDQLIPPSIENNRGVMITIHHKGGTGYAATSDLTASGIKFAMKHAQEWAEKSSKNAVTDFSKLNMPNPVGEYQSKIEIPWQSIPLQEKIDRLMLASQQLKISDKIVDWHSSFTHISKNSLYLTNHGGHVVQKTEYIIPNISVSANEGAETITRSFRHGYARQAGYEAISKIRFDQQGPILAKEALDLLSAPVCPTDEMDLLLAPDQMMLQIHESIGHPLELDRILGDERNYAGTSFVTLDMFGKYQYGSELLNVSFDPTIEHQLASYAFDDEGSKAEKVLLIENGILKKPLGGFISQQRANISGVANSRADSWSRPAMDRMANLNIEPGTSTLDKMISSVENGIYMKSNVSWSIDDSRNKFQFGCEWGQVIKDGQLKGLVKKPNYRGISESFWRSLKMVGDKSTFEVLGTPYCGKGEPNQVIRVGHASPACLFSNISVFGGE